MARIRSIHPGQWTDEDFVECSFAARLCAIALRNITDDNGIFEWKPRSIKMKLFPADNIEVEPLLDELIENNIIQKFESDGKCYGMIRNFAQYQRPEKPRFVYPVPDNYVRGYELNASYKAASNKPEVQPGNNNHTQEQEIRRPVDDQSAKSISEGIGKGIVISPPYVDKSTPGGDARARACESPPVVFANRDQVRQPNHSLKPQKSRKPSYEPKSKLDEYAEEAYKFIMRIEADEAAKTGRPMRDIDQILERVESLGVPLLFGGVLAKQGVRAAAQRLSEQGYRFDSAPGGLCFG